MAKVIGQNIPPALDILWHQLHSPARVTQGADGVVTLKKNKKQPTKKPRRNLDLIALQELAERVAQAAFVDRGKPVPENFIFLLTQDLVLGITSPQYFRKCKVESAITLESIPTYVADPAPPPYGYRTPTFMPSLPTYPDGTPTTGNANYSGTKNGQLFIDTALRWRKIVFKSPNVNFADGAKNVILKWATRIDVAATSRGSRPMFSLQLRVSLSTDTGGDLTSTAPPIDKKTIFYWRFKIPPSSPPFFNTYLQRNEVRALARVAKKSGTGLYTRYVVNASVRPMLGRGFNNNDAITTASSRDPELWEITDCFPDMHTNLQTIPFSTAHTPRDIAYSPSLGLYVACCRANMLRSTNLITFNASYTGYNVLFNSIIWADFLGMFISVGSYLSTGGISTSTNATSWTTVVSPSQMIMTVVAKSEKLGRVVAFGYGGTDASAIYTDDGITWHPGTGTIPFAAHGCIWVDELNLFVATGGGMAGYVSMTSPDGAAWTANFLSQYSELFNVAWSPYLQMLVATTSYWPGNKMAQSSNGQTWSEGPSGVENSFPGIAWCPPLASFIASGGNSGAANMLKSPNGTNWTPWATGNTLNWFNVRWIEEKCTLVAVSPDTGSIHFMKIFSGA